MSLHVDDLKVCAKTCDLKLLETELTKRFGTLKRQTEAFEHCGVWHAITNRGIVMTQDHYLRKLEQPSRERMRAFKEKTHQKCSPSDHKEFRTLLGRVEWTVTSRPEASVLAQTLQSRAHDPNYED
eukprot:1575128-Amphidinium_carterae.1